MNPNSLIAIILVFLMQWLPIIKPSQEEKIIMNTGNPYPSIGVVPLPAGYIRIPTDKNSFTIWLRKIGLKNCKTVYTYTGEPKINQSAQFAVLDISVGHRDLQQCADAVMRLRAEYLYAQGLYDQIDFRDNSNTSYKLGRHPDRAVFDAYLEKVFVHCGTRSLQKQLKKITDLNQLKCGDVLIKGGSPGHAMLVADMAINDKGRKIFLLVQSYMPAQDIHLVINPANKQLSPWYELAAGTVFTPEWTFPGGCFMTWPK